MVLHAGNLTQKHLRGSSLLLLGRMFGVATNFALQVLTVRYLPKDDYGTYALAMSLITVAAMVNAFGMDKAASRFLPMFLAKKQHAQFVGAMRLMVVTIIGIAAIILLPLLACFLLRISLPTTKETQTVIGILAFLMVTNAFDAFFVAVFAAFSRADAIFFRRHFLGPLLKLIAAGLVCVIGGGVYYFAIGQLVAGLIGFAVYVVMFLGVLKSDMPDCLDATPIYPAKDLYAFSATALSGDLAFLCRSAFIPLVIGYYHVNSEVAAFQAVLPIARLNEVIMATFAIMFVPAAAQLYATQERDKLTELYSRNAIWTTLLSFPLFIVSFAAATPLTVLVFGDAYAESGAVLAVLSLGYFANAVFGANLRLLRVAGKLRILIGVDLLMIVAAAVGLWIWVPRLGAVGGAVAVTLTILIQLVVMQYAVSKTMELPVYRLEFVSPFISAVVVGWLVRCLIAATDVSPLAAIAIAGCASIILPLIYFSQIKIDDSFPELQRFRNKWISRFRPHSLEARRRA